MAGLELRFMLLVVAANLLQCTKHTHLSQVKNQEVSIKERHKVHLTFVASDFGVNCTFTLFYNDVVFYQAGQTGVISSDEYPLDRQERSVVKVHESFDYLVVSLTVRQLKLSDAGTYSCLFQCQAINIIQNYRLHVNYPPKPARCQWHFENWHFLLKLLNLAILTCDAVNGYPPATVRCYSYKTNVAQRHDPILLEGNANLTAEFWLDRDMNVTCCSVSSAFDKDWQTCNDFYSSEPGRHTNHLPISPITPFKKSNGPGKPTCILASQKDIVHHGKWVPLECTASVGNHLGFITCYQDGDKMPPLTQPLENDTTLTQTIWIQITRPTFCCSSTLNNPKDICECEDFIRDFSQNSNDSLDLKPCPTSTASPTTVLQHTSGMHTIEILGDNVPDSDENKQSNTEKNDEPGKASCVLQTHYGNVTYGKWAPLECTASAGNHLGFIACYQDGEKMPPWTVPLENYTTLTQTIWIRPTIPIFCCSSRINELRSTCECVDFIRDFSQSSTNNSHLNPCPVSTPSATTSLPHKRRKQRKRGNYQLYECQKVRRIMLNKCM